MKTYLKNITGKMRSRFKKKMSKTDYYRLLTMNNKVLSRR